MIGVTRSRKEVAMPRTSAKHIMLRRTTLQAALCLASSALTNHAAQASAQQSQDDDNALIRRLLGRSATLSDRVHLIMPPVFSNGYSVPITLAVDSPMTALDYVRQIHVFAPKNPIIVVANFQFTPASGRAEISTRIRLSQPQAVLAVADMTDGTLLMARKWVKVETDGCS
jgi:sulfur-oxidizing protein SoxY